MKPAATPLQPETRLRRVGCVSYLNAKPLIDGLDGSSDPAVCFDVPSGLLADLESGDVDIALCPVIDYCRASRPLVLVPAGGIGCAGPTLTVRLFSRVPINQVGIVHADTDSHTSVALLRVLLAQRYGRQPCIIDYDAREHVAGGRIIDAPEAMLLIGDKVVTDSPKAVTYPHQLDLGEAWHDLTGLPFVFAVWMARAGENLGDLPQRLARQRERNADRIVAIADRHAMSHGWPADLARRYLGHTLRYAVDDAELRAIEHFFAMAHATGCIRAAEALRVYGR